MYAKVKLIIPQGLLCGDIPKKLVRACVRVANIRDSQALVVRGGGGGGRKKKWRGVGGGEGGGRVVVEGGGEVGDKRRVV